MSKRDYLRARVIKSATDPLHEEYSRSLKRRVETGHKWQKDIQAKRGERAPSAAPHVVSEMAFDRQKRAQQAYLGRATANAEIKLPNPAHYQADVKPGALKEIKVGRGGGGKAALIGAGVGVPVAGGYLYSRRKKRRQ